MTGIMWHGGHPWRMCFDCGKPVRLDKPLIGSLHMCATACEKRGRHSGSLIKKRVGPFWNRRDQFTCPDCHEVVQ